MYKSFRQLLTLAGQILPSRSQSRGRQFDARGRILRCEALEPREMLSANINEAGIGQFFYVDVAGSNFNNGSQAAPFATLEKAVDTALTGSLANGVKTKIVVNDGLYINQPNAGLWKDSNSFPTYQGQAAETVLIIEGESPEGVEFRGVNNDYRQITFEGKSNLVLRDLAFANLDSNFDFDFWGAVHLQANPDENSNGQFGPGRSHDLLLDNVEVTGSDRRGAYIGWYDDVTVIDSVFSDNIHEVGLQFHNVNDALVERTEISRNGQTGGTTPENFGNSGFLFQASNTTLRNVTASGNKEGSGIRMDFMAENVVIEDSTFNDNAQDGLFFETAFGPVTFTRITANNNARAGVHIATTNNFTVDDSELIGNGRAGFMVTEQRRDESNFTPPFFLWAQDPAYSELNHQEPGGNVVGGKPMNWNKNTLVKNTTIEATSANAAIYSSGYDNAGSWQNHYDSWVAINFTGENNNYHAVVDNAFNDSTSSGSRTFVHFATWQSLTGSDSTSTFNEAPPEPSMGDFDQDGDTDGRDFLLWQRGFGNPYTGDDLQDWQENYGPDVEPPPVPVINNHSFEVGGLAGWTVSGNLETGNYGGVSDGGTAVAFGGGNSPATGVLSQSISTTIGQTYRVLFDYKAYSGNNGLQQSLLAEAVGSGTLGSVLATENGASSGAPYTTYSYTFSADSLSTLLRFSDTSSVTNAIDGFLDNIRIELA